MKTRKLGKTGLDVSEIGFGGEWLERHPEEEGIELIKYASSKGINILDCWMADPNQETLLVKVSRIIEVIGLFRDILVLPGKMNSILEQET